MQKSQAPVVDARREELECWVADLWQLESAPSEPVSVDASFRRYFRFFRDGVSVVAMDAPPPQEDCRPFVAVAELFQAAGVNVPQIIAQDLERGFLLLEDQGDDTYLRVLDDANADALFGDAIAALVKLQLASEAGVLPNYDEALLRRELGLFPEWYLKHHLGVALEGELEALWNAVCDVLVERALAQARVFVHRDYMPRNLMRLASNNPGIIDFQDALYGPISYDPVCLFRDAFVSWPQQQVSGWLAGYWQQARDAGLPVPEDFARFEKDCDLMGAQRHLKVMGIFARINYRDGKPAYLADTPRFESYLREVAARHSELAPLTALLDRVAGLASA